MALEPRARGVAPANKLELKLVDPSNRNVWWVAPRSSSPAVETLRMRSSEDEFAWGPMGGGTLGEFGDRDGSWAIRMARNAKPPPEQWTATS